METLGAFFLKCPKGVLKGGPGAARGRDLPRLLAALGAFGAASAHAQGTITTNICWRTMLLTAHSPDSRQLSLAKSINTRFRRSISVCLVRHQGDGVSDLLQPRRRPLTLCSRDARVFLRQVEIVGIRVLQRHVTLPVGQPLKESLQVCLRGAHRGLVELAATRVPSAADHTNQALGGNSNRIARSGRFVHPIRARTTNSRPT